MNDQLLGARLSLSKRDPAAAQAVADKLARLGFANVAPASRGVSFEGSRGDFERVFGTPVIVDDRGVRFAGEPALADQFGSQVESVYFPTKPTFFAR